MPLAEIAPIATARLLIVPIAEDHIDDLMAVNGDPAVTDFLPYTTWASREDGLAWLRRMQALHDAGTARQLALRLKESGRAIGTALLFKYDEGSRRVEVGYALGQAYWRKGLMQEALAAICQVAFSDLGCRRIEAEVNPSTLPHANCWSGSGSRWKAAYASAGRARAGPTTPISTGCSPAILRYRTRARPNPSLEATLHGLARRPRDAMVHAAPRGRHAKPWRSPQLKR